MSLGDILKVCPGATPDNIHTLVEVVKDSNRWFCRNGGCDLAYVIIDKFGKEDFVWIRDHDV